MAHLLKRVYEELRHPRVAYGEVRRTFLRVSQGLGCPPSLHAPRQPPPPPPPLQTRGCELALLVRMRTVRH